MYNSWGDFTGDQQLSAANYMVIFRFFCENAHLVNNLIQFRYLSISGQVLNTLKNQIPGLFEYQNDNIWWAAKLFSLLSNPPTLTRGQLTILNNIAQQSLDPDGTQLAGILRLYYDRTSFPDPAPPLCEQMFNYFLISYDTFKWIIRKTKLACALVSSYKKLRETVDQLGPTLTAVRIGELNISAAQSRGKTAYNLRKQTFEAASKYFQSNIPYLRVDAPATSDFLASYLQGATYEADIEMVQLCEWKNNNQLHLKFSDFTPISIFTWDDVGNYSNRIDDYFTTLSTFNLSPAAIALQKLPQLQEEIRNLRIKIEPLVGTTEDFIFESKDLQQTILLIQDVENLTKNIMEAVRNGILWQDMEIEKNELDFWRLGLLKLKKHIEEINTEKQKNSKASSELYSKVCKPRTVPKIHDEESYAQFYFIFQQEVKNYQTEELKISLLRSCIVNRNDKNNTAHLSSSSTILSYLTTTYGGFSTQIKMIIKSLSKLKKARNPQEQLDNISKVISIIMVLKEQNSLQALKQENISSLINNTFETLSKDYWRQYSIFLQDLMKENNLSQEEFQNRLD